MKEYNNLGVNKVQVKITTADLHRMLEVVGRTQNMGDYDPTYKETMEGEFTNPRFQEGVNAFLTKYLLNKLKDGEICSEVLTAGLDNV